MCYCCCYNESICGPATDPYCGTSPKSKCWCQWDLCGWVCAIITYLLMMYGWYTTIFHVIRPWRGNYSIHEFLFTVLMFLAFWAHCKGQFTDPGTIPPNAKPIAPTGNGNNTDHTDNSSSSNNLMPICNKCHTYKPPHAHHCSICNRCVSRMDHHCPWLNSCVGASNLKMFLLFCFYIFSVSFYALILTISKTLSCARYGNEYSALDYDRLAPEYCRSHVTTTLFIVFLCIECILFGLFTMCMLCDQYPNVTTGQTHIDNYKLTLAEKARRARGRTLKDNLAMVFGDGGFSPLWFLPIDPKWKRPELVLEYVLSVSSSSSSSKLEKQQLHHHNNNEDLENGHRRDSSNSTSLIIESTDHSHEVAKTAFDYAHPTVQSPQHQHHHYVNHHHHEQVQNDNGHEKV
jgi:hypothetical protein